MKHCALLNQNYKFGISITILQGRYLHIVIFLLFTLLSLNTSWLYSQEFGWTQIPVEKYKYFRNDKNTASKVYAGVGKLFIKLSSKNIEFIGIEYKNKSSIATLFDTTKATFNFVFSEKGEM